MKIRTLVILFSVVAATAFGASRHPKVANHTLVPKMSDANHYYAGIDSLQKAKWKEAVQHFSTLLYAYPTSSFLEDGHFYLGIGYYHLSEFEIANEAFTQYLQSQSSPTFFQEAIEYKFAIAENFRSGAKCRAFGLRPMPKIASGKERAVEIYDEIIATVPSHDMAIKALYSKAHNLWNLRDYQGGVDAFRLLIRRYPRHELAPESYVATMKLYLDQSQHEPQNHDILPLAQINLTKFEQDFPRDPRLNEVKQDLVQTKEIYAKGFYEMGQFYERMGKPKAAYIYYQGALEKYPETATANLCRKRLHQIAPKIDALTT